MCQCKKVSRTRKVSITERVVVVHGWWLSPHFSHHVRLLADGERWVRTVNNVFNPRPSRRSRQRRKTKAAESGWAEAPCGHREGSIVAQMAASGVGHPQGREPRKRETRFMIDLPVVLFGNRPDPGVGEGRRRFWEGEGELTASSFVRHG